VEVIVGISGTGASVTMARSATFSTVSTSLLPA